MHILRSENIRYTLFIPDLGNYPDHNRTSTSQSHFCFPNFTGRDLQRKPCSM